MTIFIIIIIIWSKKLGGIIVINFGKLLLNCLLNASHNFKPEILATA